MENQTSSTHDRELVLTRTLDAPVELVWEVWTQPGHIANWWGPDDFTTTITTMDVQPGGEWNLVLHGPDGTDYDNKSIFREIIPLKKIVYEHITYPWILATIDFEALGEQTMLRWHMLFASSEDFIKVAEIYQAAEGHKQNVKKLGNYLAGLKHQQ